MKLTDTELSWLDGVFTQVSEELNQRLVELGNVPLRYQGSGIEATSSVEGHTERLRRVLKREAHSEDFIALEALGRVRLSDQTRKAEMRRLNRKYGRRKKYKLKYGKKHHKTKQATAAVAKAKHNNARWDKDPLTRLKYSLRKNVLISPTDWDRCIAPVWNKYDRKYLKIRCKDKDMTVHNVVIVYHPPKERYSRKAPTPVVVYDGYSQAVHDAMLVTSG